LHDEVSFRIFFPEDTLPRLGTGHRRNLNWHDDLRRRQRSPAQQEMSFILEGARVETRRKCGKQLIFADVRTADGKCYELKISAPPLTEEAMQVARASIKTGDVVRAVGEMNSEEAMLVCTEPPQVEESWAGLHVSQAYISASRQEATAKRLGQEIAASDNPPIAPAERHTPDDSAGYIPVLAFQCQAPVSERLALYFSEVLCSSSSLMPAEKAAMSVDVKLLCGIGRIPDRLILVRLRGRTGAQQELVDAMCASIQIKVQQMILHDPNLRHAVRRVYNLSGSSTHTNHCHHQQQKEQEEQEEQEEQKQQKQQKKQRQDQLQGCHRHATLKAATAHLLGQLNAMEIPLAYGKGQYGKDHQATKAAPAAPAAQAENVEDAARGVDKPASEPADVGTAKETTDAASSRKRKRALKREQKALANKPVLLFSVVRLRCFPSYLSQHVQREVEEQQQAGAVDTTVGCGDGVVEGGVEGNTPAEERDAKHVEPVKYDASVIFADGVYMSALSPVAARAAEGSDDGTGGIIDSNNIRDCIGSGLRVGDISVGGGGGGGGGGGSGGSGGGGGVELDGGAVVCRSYYKLREAVLRTGMWPRLQAMRSSSLQPGDASSPQPLSAIDVGSSPGGWTQYLATGLGCSAIASVDPGAMADLPPQAEHLPMTWQNALPLLKARQQEGQQEGKQVAQQGGGASVIPPFDMFVTDINKPPADCVSLLRQAAPLLRPGSPVVLTMKKASSTGSSSSAGFKQAVASAMEELRTFCDDVRLTHLLANTTKEETITCYLR
jgi:hypothetical protein